MAQSSGVGGDGDGVGGRQRRPRSCLGVTLGAALDGAIFGSAIGAFMAAGNAYRASSGGLKILLRSGAASGMSVGGFLATYNGGVCSLEKLRTRKDFVNPFIVGGFMGVAGAVPGYLQPLPAAPWAYRNPRALISSGFTSCVLPPCPPTLALPACVRHPIARCVLPFFINKPAFCAQHLTTSRLPRQGDALQLLLGHFWHG